MKKYRYLLVRIEDVKIGHETAFTAVRKNLHNYATESGIKLADMGLNMLKPEQKTSIENIFDRTLERAKEITRMRDNENPTD